MPPLSAQAKEHDSVVHSSSMMKTVDFKKESKVSFASIEVREYERVVGDHPGTQHGPPLSIGWAFVQHTAMDLDRYEVQRRQKGIRPLTCITRRLILRDAYEISAVELVKAENDVSRIRIQRNQTRNQGKCAELSEEATESLLKFGRKLKRTITFGASC